MTRPPHKYARREDFGPVNPAWAANSWTIPYRRASHMSTGKPTARPAHAAANTRKSPLPHGRSPCNNMLAN